MENCWEPAPVLTSLCTWANHLTRSCSKGTHWDYPTLSWSGQNISAYNWHYIIHNIVKWSPSQTVRDKHRASSVTLIWWLKQTTLPVESASSCTEFDDQYISLMSRFGGSFLGELICVWIPCAVKAYRTQHAKTIDNINAFILV